MSTAPPAISFLDAAARSRLLSAARVAALRSKAGSPARLAADLVAAGELTAFQADKLLRGQWQGLILGPYTILAPLGRGGMGVVYRATDAGHDVALKILPPPKARAEPRTEARFLREMALGAYVPRHPNLAGVYASGTASGVNYIAMEFVPGDTLRAVIVAGGTLAVPLACGLFAQVAAGLQAAHADGLIHRDVKPGNVMVTPDGFAKILDFGFAIRGGERESADPNIVGGPGVTLGTMDYIAPEQIADAAAVTPAADLYSLGCSLYFALAGGAPFPGGTATQKIRWHRSEPPPPVRSLNPDVPAELAAIVEKLMAKRPDDRHENAAAAERDLLRWADKPAAIVIPVAAVEEVEVGTEDMWAATTDAAAAVVLPIRRGETLAWIAALAAGLVFAAGCGFLMRVLTR